MAKLVLYLLSRLWGIVEKKNEFFSFSTRLCYNKNWLLADLLVLWRENLFFFSTCLCYRNWPFGRLWGIVERKKNLFSSLSTRVSL